MRLITRTLVRQSELHENLTSVLSTEPGPCGSIKGLAALPLVLLPGTSGLTYQLEMHIQYLIPKVAKRFSLSPPTLAAIKNHKYYRKRDRQSIDCHRTQWPNNKNPWFPYLDAGSYPRETRLKSKRQKESPGITRFIREAFQILS